MVISRLILIEAILAVLVTGAMTASAPPAAASEAVTLLGFSSADFDILDPASMAVIGQAHYAVVKDGDLVSLHGHDRYADGEYDFERDRFETPAGTLPILISADHYFFHADGAPEIRSNFDLESGISSCIDFRARRPITRTAQLAPPAHTWAGASVMIPIQDFLRSGAAGILVTHVLNCAPGPKIFTVKVSIAKTGTSIPFATPGLIEVDLKPDYGWWNMLIAPFVPHLRAWFDPLHGWKFMGASLARFYRGPRITLERISERAEHANATPPRD